MSEAYLRSSQVQGHYVSQQMAFQYSTAPGDTTEHQLKVKVPIIIFEERRNIVEAMFVNQGFV